MLLLAMTLWTGLGSLAGATRQVTKDLTAESQHGTWICCVCPKANGATQEITLPSTRSCPGGCHKLGAGTFPGQAYHYRGDQACRV